MIIHIEIYIASRMLEKQKGTFSKHDLLNFIKDEFNDERSGLKTQASSKCVANSPLNFANGYNYLWRVERGVYRCFNPNEDLPFQGRGKLVSCSNKKELPTEYQYLVEDKNSTKIISNPKTQPETQSGSSTINKNRLNNIVDLLDECGKRMGFETRKEYAVPMGRIDIVWLLKTPFGKILGNDGKLPIFGFEIESSWRTRKHIKGDITNLQQLKASCGVIVLQKGPEDSEKEINSLISNSKEFLLNINAKDIRIWTDFEILEMCKVLKVDIY